MYKKYSLFFLMIAYSSSILVAQVLPKARFIPQDLSMQNIAKTRQFKGLNFSMNKAGHAIAVWSVSDPDVPTDGAIQAAYFNGTTWALPGLNDFISDTTKESELPWVNLNDNDQAVAVWHQTTDRKICANRFINMVWQGPEDVAFLDGGTDFAPTQGRVRVGINNDANAQAFVIWLQKNNDTQDSDSLFFSTNNGILAGTWENKTKIIITGTGGVFFMFPQLSFSSLAHALCVGNNVVFIIYSETLQGLAGTESKGEVYSIVNKTLSSGEGLRDLANVRLRDTAADVSCSNDNKNINAVQSGSCNVPENIVAEVLGPAVVSTSRFSTFRLENPEGAIQQLPVASGINTNADLAFLQIQTEKPTASTLLYLAHASFDGTTIMILNDPCLSFNGLNDIPQLCMNDRGDGAFIYYNEPTAGANGKIAFGGFRKEDDGSFSCTSVPYELKEATLKTRTDVGSNLPFYLDCARNSGGQNNSYGGIIWWDETDDTKIIRSFIAQNTNTPLLPSSLTGLKGVCCLNRFPDQSEYFNRLTWVPANDSDIIKQLVERNGVVIAELPPTQDSFVDHNRPAGVQEKYGIVTVVHASGQDRLSVPATVTPSC